MELGAVSLPLLIRRGVDAVTHGEPLRLVLQIAIVMLAAAGLKAVLQFFGRQAFIGISRDVEYDLRNA
jgi:hypothetical protein